MINKENDELVKKYFAAESTLSEEKRLFNSKTQTKGNEEWSTYIRQKRKKAPFDLKDTIWEAIQTRKRKQQRFHMTLSIAAAIGIFMIAYISTPKDKNMSYERKSAILKEALSMFLDPTTTTVTQNIIYEDDLVIIYVASK